MSKDYRTFTGANEAAFVIYPDNDFRGYLGDPKNIVVLFSEMLSDYIWHNAYGWCPAYNTF